MPTDQRHFRTFVTLANETVASEYAHFGDSSKVWVYYPDDESLKGLHPGDSRAALTPFLAHEVCNISLTHLLYIYSYLLIFTCVFIHSLSQYNNCMNGLFSFFWAHAGLPLPRSVCCGTMPPRTIILFVLILKIRLNCLHYIVIGERCLTTRQQK